MKLIKTLILLSLFLCLMMFFADNNQTLNVTIPFSEYSLDMNLSSYTVIALFIGSIIGFALRRSNKRDFMLRERALKDDVKRLETQKRIYESELKVQNQLSKN